MASRIAVLDGLRGMAVLLVLLYHGHIGAENTALYGIFGRLFHAVGWSGVDMFFVLSGFLITGILIRARDSGGAYFVPFYMRRLLRIFPLYTFALVLALGVLPLLGIHWTDRGWTYWLYVSNYGAIFYGSDPELNHFWSLSVEEHFYLVWPLLLYLTPRRWLGHAMVAVGAASILARFGHALHGDSVVMMWIATHTRLDALALGGLMALWLPGAAVGRVRVAAGLLLFGGMAALALMGPQVGDWQGPFTQTAGFACYAALYGGLLLATLTAAPGELLHRLFASGWLGFFGRYSYAIYVFHAPIDHLLRAGGWFPADHPALVGPTGVRVWATLVYDVVLVTLSTAAALGTWHLFEARLLSLKGRWPYGRRPAEDGGP